MTSTPSTPQNKIISSPDGAYRLECTPKGKEGGWGQWDIRVMRADGSFIADTSRNYHALNVLTFFQRKGCDYLLISEDYHGGYGCLDLHTGRKVHHKPSEKGEHWCWASVLGYDEHTETLRVAGCYWACPYDVITWKISDPMVVPYAIVAVQEDIDEPSGARCAAWLNNTEDAT